MCGPRLQSGRSSDRSFRSSTRSWKLTRRRRRSKGIRPWWNRLGFQSRLVCDSLLSMIRRGIVMGKAYSQDLRERVIAAVDAGTGGFAAGALFRVSGCYIYKALGRRERTGQTSVRPWAGGPKPKLAAHDDALRAHVMNKPRYDA